ncbi:MAG: hypothetical protein ACYTBW_04670 [Planctomycetota bacterium]|jgi:hypothetical protein
MRLNIKAFALACGLIWGFVGSLVGMVWGLVDAGIGGAIFAWLYNLMSKKCTKSE